MLKKAVTYFTFLLLFIIVVVFSYNEGCSLALGKTLELKSIPAIDQAQLHSITSGKEESTRSFLSFSYAGFDLPPYDAANNAYLICRSMLDRVSVFQNIRCEVKAVFSGDAVTIVACKGDAYRIYSFETTTLPLLFLQTGRPESTPIGDKESSGMLTVLENGVADVQKFTANFKKRGGMSRAYPKSGMLVKLMDTRGAQVSASILGLSENTEFALNSLYDDSSKMRDFASLTLWETISQTGRTNARKLDFRIVMAEVFVNGTYAGLYGFQENVNLASFALAGTEGLSLFKVTSNKVPNPADLDPLSDAWGDILLKETTAKNPWAVLENAVGQLFGGAEGVDQETLFQLFDRENCIDYVIWCNLLAAKDNLWKNVVLLTEEINPAQARVEIVPWDADLTFGAEYDAEQRLLTSENEAIATKLLSANRNDLYSVLWSDCGKAFREETAERWFALRQSVLSERSLSCLLDGAYSLASDSGARRRDAQRWPQSAQSADNALIERFIRQRLPVLDAYYADYLSAQD